MRATSDARLLLLPGAMAGRGAPQPQRLASGGVDPTRKRKLRLVVALTAAVLLAAALIYTSFSASTEAEQAEPSSSRARSYELTGKVVNGSISHRGDQLRFRVRDRDGTASVPGHLHGHRARPVPRRARGDRLGRARARHVRGRARLARHEVPVEVHQGRAVQLTMAGVGSACLAVALLTAAYAVGASLYGARTGRREWVTSGRRAIYCIAGLLRDRLRAARGRPSCARTSRSRWWPRAPRPTRRPSTRSPRCGRRRTGSLLLWATLLSLFLERGAVPDPPLAARDRAVRDRRARRDRRLLPAADGRLGEPVRHAREPAGRGRGPQPAAAPPGDDDPPADALHGLRRLLDPVRVRHRRADHAPHRRRLDPRHAPLRADRLDLPRHRHHARRAVVVHRARLGRLLGAGTRWRTRR